MIALIALVIQVLAFLPTINQPRPPIFIAPMPTTEEMHYVPGCLCSMGCMSIDREYEEFHADAVKEYEDEFTALFNSYEMKRAKNGALMIRRGNSGSYKFCKKG